MSTPDPGRQRRSDAELSRSAILDAAARELQSEPVLDMSRLAERAGVSRSTLYRHFPNPAAVQLAVLERALTAATARIRSVVAEDRPPLASARRAVDALVEVGSTHGLDRTGHAELGGRVEELASTLRPLLERVGAFAEIAPAPPDHVADAAATHIVASALRAGVLVSEPAAAAETVFVTLTEPLGHGLVVLEPDGTLIAANPLAGDAFAGVQLRPGEQLISPGVETFYEDGSPCPADEYPLALAVRTGESPDRAVRGHRVDGTMRWFAISALVLRRAPADPAYALLGVFADVTQERQSEVKQLQPPGALQGERAPRIDVARALDKVPAPLLPEQLVAEARRFVGVPVALYVVDIDGTFLLRLAGAEAFPARLQAPLALGPELAEDGIPALGRWLAEELPGARMSPMWLRGRAVGLLLGAGGDQATLDEVAQQAAPAMELANGYTDVFDAARRRKEINPAAEIQQSLLPPRIARMAGGQIACGVLPSYEVGGDWVDYVDNRDGAWIAIADAAGRGPRAAALGSIALAALRAARRNDQSLEAAVQTMHETVCDAGFDDFHLTALVARWSPVYSVFSWVNAGHPPPLVLRADGGVDELASEPDLPLGLFERKRDFRRSYRRLAGEDRVVLYTDGISTRPTADGLFGRDGIVAAARSASGTSASAIARAIQEAVVGASEQPLRDDAAVAVLAPAPLP